MREVKIGSQNFTKVIALDTADAENLAHHKYSIKKVHKEHNEPQEVYGIITFQNGPVKEAGINGCHQEDLIAVVIDRLQCFQRGIYACRENELALTKLEEAMHWLNHRTSARVARGVEGTSIK